jgi:hypothetical protein
MELAEAQKAPYSRRINQQKWFLLFFAPERSEQHPIKVEENFRLTSHLLDQRHVR